MAFVTFTALRSLTSGVSAGDQVSFSFVLSQCDRKFTVEKTAHKTLSGSYFFRQHSSGASYSVGTFPQQTQAQNEAMTMFLDSVSGGEVFLADWYSDSAGAESAHIIENGYQQQRVNGQIFEYFFEAIEQ